MIGERLGNYEVIEEVGQGGMSVVYRGRDATLERDVAIKVLHPHLAKKESYRRRFQREARAVARLQHPNIPEIYEYSGDQAEHAYIVTEFVPGRTLREHIDAHPIEIPEVGVAIAACVAGALHHAHMHGVVHRDVKPENVIVTEGGLLKLTDFGIAHLQDGQGLTMTGTLLGSPAHMAPEHIDGKAMDARADVFALGTVLYWLVTHRLPFVGPNAQALFRTILDGDYQPAVQVNRQGGQDISDIIDRAMAKSPKDRYSDAQSMREALVESLRAVGLGELVDTFGRYFEDPAGFQEQLRERVVDGLVARGQVYLQSGRKARALRCFDRVLAFNPEEPRVLAEMNRLAEADSRVTWLRRCAAALLLLTATALGWWSIERPQAPLPSDGTGTEAAVSSPAAPSPSSPSPTASTAVSSDGASRAPGSPTAGDSSPKAPSPEKGSEAPGASTRTKPSGPRPQVKAASPPPRRGAGAKRTPTPRKGVRVASASAVSRPATPIRPVWLSLQVKPWADVFVDGNKVATVPPASGVYLTAGEHTVTLRHRGNRPQTRRYDIRSDSGPPPAWRLWLPAIVHVVGAPGHILQVQNRDLGSTSEPREFPMSDQRLERARVVVVHPSLGPVHEEEVTLKAGAKVTIAVR